MGAKYYIPIKSVNLAHYLSSGIITPSIYIENRNPDIQDKFKNYLLLSPFKYTVETNCAIEIVLNPREEVPREISKNFFVFDMPLPISRIKSVFFLDEEQKINTEFNITSGAAFIPKAILKTLKENSISIDELEGTQLKPSVVDWSSFLKKYDQLMGGFATMKIAKESFQNYPTHYFRSLGNINEFFNNILNKHSIEIENNFEFAFTDTGKFKVFHDTIYNEINSNVVQNYALKDNIKLETRNGLIQIDKIPDNTQTYLVAILESYGQGKRKHVDSFISDLISGKFLEKKKEGLALIFGLNKGYKGFRNKYKTDNFETTIKFKLDSQLDYYIIESIYQKVFNSLNNIGRFDYIDDWSIKSESEQADTSSFVTYRILDKDIVLKKKEDVYNELFISSLEKSSKIYDVIYEKISGWFPKFIKTDAEGFKAYFKAELDLSLREFAKEIYNGNKAELEAKNTIIDDLHKSVQEKDEIINSFKKQFQESNNHNQRFQSEFKPSNFDKPTKSEEPSINIKHSYGYSEEFTNASTTDKTMSLFSDAPEISKKLARETELKALKVPALSKIAKELKISKYHSLSKLDLILEILKTEF